METLRRYRVLETGSVVTARNSSPLFERPGGLQPIGPTDDFRMIINSMVLEDIRLSAVGTTGHRVRPLDAGNVTVLTPLLGTLSTDDGRRSLQVGPGEIALPRPGTRNTVIPMRYVGLVAQVPMRRLEARVAQNPLDWWHPDRDWHDTGKQDRALLRYLRFLVEELDADDALLHSKRAAHAAAVMLTDLLLDAVQPADDAQPKTPEGADWQVRRAEEAIRAGCAEMLSVAALAAELGLSTRALQMAFLRHRGRTPSQAIASARLEAAHRRLSAAVPGDTVTGIALECGVTHFGRFAAKYRAQFGEHPSKALARRLHEI